jgi:hypothetical protein
MPIYTVTESIELLDSGKCGNCAGVLVEESLRDRISTPQGDAFFDRGVVPYCNACKLYWTTSAIEERRAEANRIKNLTRE